MKKIILFSLLGAVVFYGFGQQNSGGKKQTIHGMVKNEKNKPVPGAYVIAEGDNSGVLTDTFGFFKLSVKPDAVLTVSSDGYNSTEKKLKGEDDILIILKLSATGSGTGMEGPGDTFRQQTISNAFQDFSKKESGNFYYGSAIPVFHQKEETKGSRYLFSSWVSGSVINDRGEVISNDDMLFNYDKISGALMATTDKIKMVQINQQAITSFNLTGETGKYKFVNQPLISTKGFLLELAGRENKYFLYKSIKTNFEKADYKSDGLVESGKDYDEYVDVSLYYILFPGGKLVKPVELKRRAIKETLEIDKEKVRAFFSANKDKFVDESFLVQLINALNQ